MLHCATSSGVFSSNLGSHFTGFDPSAISCFEPRRKKWIIKFATDLKIANVFVDKPSECNKISPD